MARNMKFLSAALLAGAVVAFGAGINSASAAIQDSANYTLTIPTVNRIFLKDSTTFGAITANQFGVADTGAHLITMTGADSYVESNDANAGSGNFEVTFSAYNGETVALSGGVLTLTKSGSSVDVLVKNGAQAAAPKLGTVSMTEDGANKKLTATGITFASGKAELDMSLDLDETTLSTDDTAQELGVTVTFTALNLD